MADLYRYIADMRERLYIALEYALWLMCLQPVSRYNRILDVRRVKNYFGERIWQVVILNRRQYQIGRFH